MADTSLKRAATPVTGKAPRPKLTMPEPRISESLRQIEARFDTQEEIPIAQPGRHLLKEAKVWKQGKMSKSSRILMLFNDLMFVCQQRKDGKLVPKEFYPLDEVQLDQDVRRGLMRPKNAIKVKRKTDKEDDFIIIMFEDEDTLEMWVKLIKISAESYIKNIQAKGDSMEYGWSCRLHKGDLHWCAREGEFKEAESLLEGGADVNVKNNEGLTPLHLAIVSNRQEVVQLLLNYRANPAFKDAQGDTSLHLAMQKGTPGILQDLCKAKDSDVDVPNHNGVLPLEIAVVKGDLKSVQTLIAAKADPTKTSKERKVSIAWLAFITENRKPQLLDLLLSSSQKLRDYIFNERNSDGDTIFHATAKRGHDDGLWLLLKWKADGANIKNAMKKTPLHAAVLSDAAVSRVKDTIELLVAYRALPNARDAEYCTPLHYAKGEIAKLMIKYGGQAKIENKDGKTPSIADGEVKAAEEERLARTLSTTFKEVVSEGSDKWQPDESSVNCPLCDRAFSFMTRRHHCRRCGTLACKNCSMKKVDVDEGPEKPQRVCDLCFNEMDMKSKPAFAEQPEEEKKADNVAAVHEVETSKSKSKLEKKPKKPEKLTGLEKRMLKERNPQTKEEKRAYREAIRKKHGLEKRERPQKVQTTQDQMAENMKLAQQNKEQLEEIDDAAEQMASEAKNFLDLAKKIKEKQKKNAGWL
ncbi:hypothetical protein AAMO2058_000212400 [Amorphochlora amoebiformis]